MLLYSALVKDLEIVACFLVFQDRVEVKNRNKRTTSLEAVDYSSKSNEETASVNVEDTSSIAAKIQVSQFLEGKLVLMGDDWKLLKPMKADGQASAMDPFPCLSHTFGTHNTTNKVATDSASDTPSNNGENGLVNVIKSDSLNSIIPIFYANWLNGEQSKKVANLHTLIASTDDRADVAVSLESVLENVWSRFCHVRTMMNSKGIFFFKFSSNSEMESMIENGPWLIHNVPLILRKWYRLVNVAKEDLQSVPVWLKLHDVPIMAFTEDGLSVISIKLGTPLMLDTYTTSMCMESWVWSSSAREMIDIHADVKLKDTLVMSVPKIEFNAARSSGKKIVTSNPFDVLNVFDKDIGVTSSDSVSSEDNDNETASFMASKSCKGKDSSKSGGGTGKKSLYECWRDDYNSNNYYYDEECEDLTEDQLAFRDAFDISLRGQIRR
ncbi:copia-type polyprotein [Tanacetum coccineum]